MFQFIFPEYEFQDLNYDINISNFRIKSTEKVSDHVLNYYAIHDYISTDFKNVSESVNKVRELVYKFKNGINTQEISSLIETAIKNKFTTNNNYCLLVIPASTKKKNIKRYSQFCTDVSSKCKICNGFSAIEVTDHEPTKGKSDVDKTANLTFISSIYTGKDVLLFDDVITSGCSFAQVAKKLLETGANSVTGIFLAKTR